MSGRDTLDQINKRFSLNWLIQGAAQHAGMTLHHLLRDELEAIQPGLVALYDQYALINLLQYWEITTKQVFGAPRRFWHDAQADPEHIFHNHPVLRKHGGPLAEISRKRALARCRAKGYDGLRFDFPRTSEAIITRLEVLEADVIPALENLAKQAAVQVWGVPIEKLDASITEDVHFGEVTRPKTRAGLFFSMGIVGYGGVLRTETGLKVVGKGTNWYLLAKELIKGTAELICLHGLSGLDDETFRAVVESADGIDYEPWMLQTGGELWRQLLAAKPPRYPIADMLMHISRLPAKSLEALMFAILEDPAWAKELLAGIGRA